MALAAVGLLLWPNRKQERSHAQGEGGGKERKAAFLVSVEPQCVVSSPRVPSLRCVFSCQRRDGWRSNGSLAFRLLRPVAVARGARKHTKTDAKRLGIPLSTHVRGVVLCLRALRANLATTERARTEEPTHNSLACPSRAMDHGCCAGSMTSGRRAQQRRPLGVGFSAAIGSGSWSCGTVTRECVQVGTAVSCTHLRASLMTLATGRQSLPSPLLPSEPVQERTL
jgi:hypothetical protein